MKLNPVESQTDAFARLLKIYDLEYETLKDENIFQKSVNLLLERLDYDSGELWMWTRLINLLDKLKNLDLGDRSEWWPQLHFSPISSTLDWNLEIVVITLSVASMYISPNTYSNSLLRYKMDSLRPLSKSLENFIQNYPPAWILLETFKD